ncbi:MAG: hypothetical protein JSU96_16060 [Acidobacteriota bacterium]|nr:MAG: hypothetical protein JSU96_16060 [Acidobacteriota bacterium]
MKKLVTILALAALLLPANGMVNGQTNTQQDEALKDTAFVTRTMSPLSASVNKKGDRFTLQVISPDEYKNGQIEGEVRKAKASGKVKGKSELLFGFDRLILKDGTEVPIEAELVGVSNSEGVKDVDEEGRVIGKSSKKKDITRTAILSGLGALVGGLAGGGKGAAAGAAIGAGIGLTIAFSTKGEDIRFDSGSTFELSVTQENKDSSKE